MSKHPGQKVIYRRVSTADQSTLRQLHEEMHFDREFEYKYSGKNTDRPQLKECLEYLLDGDTLYGHSIARLARNLKDLLIYECRHDTLQAGPLFFPQVVRI